MFRSLQYLLLLSFFTFQLQAQTILISSINNEYGSSNTLCIGQRAFIKYTKTGNFTSNNVLTVQVKTSYDGENTWKSVNTIDSSGTLIFTLPESLINYTYGNSGYFNSDFRVVTSSPKVNSNTLQYKAIFSLPVVEFTSIQKKVLYPYESVSIGLKLSGSTPMNLLTSDSSKISLTYFNANSDNNLFNVNPSKSGVYSIIEASNMCGKGIVKGGTNITVIDKRLQITGLSNLHVCKNGKLDIYYSTSGNWDANNKFRIRLVDMSLNGSKFYNFEASETNGVLSTTISDAIPIGFYNIQIITANGPAIESPYFQSYISIHNELKVDFTAESTSISFGETKNLNYSISGYGSFLIELNNGQIIKKTDVLDDVINSYISVSPKSTTHYSIKSFSSSCGVGKGSKSILVTVNDGIKTDSLKAGKYCLGSSVEVKFSSNKAIKIGSKIKVRLLNDPFIVDSIYGFPYRDVVGTVIRENIASFILPMNLPESFSNNTFYVSVATDELKNVSVSPNSIYVLSLPSALITNLSGVTLASPQTLGIQLLLNGAGTYEITLSNNQKYKIEHNYVTWGMTGFTRVYFPKSEEIWISSIKNICGTNSSINPDKKTVIVENNNFSIQLSTNEFQPIEICAGKKIDINLLIKGNFQQDNQYSAELIPDNNSLPKINLGTIKADQTQLLIPSNVKNGKYSLRVSSSNPFFYSNELTIAVMNIPTISISNSASQNILLGEIAPIDIKISGGGNVEVAYSDGTNESYGLGFYDYSTTIIRQFTQTGTFAVKSLSNICGIGKIDENNTVTVKVKNYNIINRYYNYANNISGYYCRNFKIPIPFDIVGKVDSTTTFSVQIAKPGDTNYTTILFGVKQSPALISIPESYTDVDYNIRIISSDNLVQSEPVGLRLKYSPELSLKLSNGNSEATINAGESITLYTQLKYENYGVARYLIIDDKNNKTNGEISYGSTTLEEIKKPTENTIYTLTSVFNECGIGKASGSVKITVNPVVSMTFENTNLFCNDKNIQANITALGTFGTDNIFKIIATNDNGATTTLLTTSKTGKIVIQSNSQLKSGSYKIQIESSNPYQLKDVSYINLRELLDVTILGNPIINQGNPAYILFKNNKGSAIADKNNFGSKEDVSFELSDGTSGSFYLNSNWPSSILVFPNNTTTYTLKSINNVCGPGKIKGSATVTVNPYANKQVSLSNILSTSTSYCRGAIVSIPFFSTGAYSAQNKFTVQISDSTGKNYQNLITEGNTSPLRAKIPMDLPLGHGYYIRVLASDSDASATSSNVPITILEAITARFDTESYYFNENKPIIINLTFTGTPPFTFVVGSDELNTKIFYSEKTHYSITLNPLANTSLRLFSVGNVNTCGTGTVVSPSTVKIELVTALEELGKLGINVFPNPTSNMIYIESNDKEGSIQLVDFSGKIIQEQILSGEQKQIDISKVSAGTYFLRVLKEAQVATFKIIKL